MKFLIQIYSYRELFKKIHKEYQLDNQLHRLIGNRNFMAFIEDLGFYSTTLINFVPTNRIYEIVLTDGIRIKYSK